ncbi:uncharacterized protein LOC123652360 isoform X2 [Pipistrellus kuhlii]|uniref:uncharacterized protein LOC123652360 isoform X2 n=1 Tax=Pipistrellus kuhlii TaxID=59472 RepID=UPI001E27361A|nr:uncharacterized protein LOC123652360 isoform X2 [Pipistrellus kuhlii]
MGAAGGGLREARGGLGAARSPGEREPQQREEEEEELARRPPAPSALPSPLPPEPEANNPGRLAAEPWPIGWSRRDCRTAGGLAVSAPGCAPALRARGPAWALLSAVCASRRLSSRGSGEETHFQSSCTEGEMKAFAAFQSNGSPRIDGISLAAVCTLPLSE